MAEGDLLVARLSPSQIGFAPERVWNPSPSVRHRTEPYEVPRRIEMGIRGTEESGAKFSPPPFAVVVEGHGRRALAALAADGGWHRWNQAAFSADRDGVRAEVDLEGHTDPSEALSHVGLYVLDGVEGEARMELLARGLRQLYPQAYARVHVPDWWLRPIYCGWGDQVTTSMWLEGVGPEPRALAYCTQGLYERWIRRLQKAAVPAGTVIVDAGWSPAGTWEPNTERWPDLRGFIARQHQAGRRVLLWLATWLWQGLPDEWCAFAGDVKLTTDPTQPEYRAHIRRQVARLVGPGGYDADGFKIDQLAFCPSERAPMGGARFGETGSYGPPPARIRLAGDLWGCELLHQLQKDIYDAAKAAKPDALVTSSTVHPYFHDTFDMVRLHDMGHVATDIMAAMKARADLARAALPGKPIDTDDWVHSDYALWMRYTTSSHALGVPCTLYAERFMQSWSAEPATRPIPLADLRRIARAWARAGHQAPRL